MTNSFDIKARRKHDETIRSQALATSTESNAVTTGDQSVPLTSHAQLPWHLYQGRNGDVFRKCRTVCASDHGNTFVVAYCDYLWPERAEANAALIVRAVNSHEDMLAALEDLLAMVCGEVSGPQQVNAITAGARAAILKATGAVSEHQSSASGNDAGQPKADGPETNRAKATGAPAS